jgi:hypothetical protein
VIGNHAESIGFPPAPPNLSTAKCGTRAGAHATTNADEAPINAPP